MTWVALCGNPGKNSMWNPLSFVDGWVVPATAAEHSGSVHRNPNEAAVAARATNRPMTSPTLPGSSWLHGILPLPLSLDGPHVADERQQTDEEQSFERAVQRDVRAPPGMPSTGE